ncbi:hypothetical protein HDU67_008565 [Dinochytrium kinnereticum]|nr:hypothetical protein HDU67_008565 [Dinochytrium kinnereticum]
MDFMKNKIMEEMVGEKVSKIAGQYLGEDVGDHVAVMAQKLALDASDGHIDTKASSEMIMQGFQNMVEGKPAKPEPPKPEGIMGFVDNLIHPNKNDNNSHQSQPQQQQNGDGGLMSQVMAATANGEGGALGSVGALFGKLTGNRELEQELKDRNQN